MTPNRERAAIDAATERLNMRAALAAEGRVSVELADDGSIVVYHPDGTASVWAEQVGPAYTSRQIAELLEVSEQAVEELPLLALGQPDGRVVYPVMQFDGDRPVAGLDQLIAVLSPVVATPWTIASWLTTPDTDGRRPIDRLKDGDIDPVVADARRLAQRLSR